MANFFLDVGPFLLSKCRVVKINRSITISMFNLFVSQLSMVTLYFYNFYVHAHNMFTLFVTNPSKLLYNLINSTNVIIERVYDTYFKI